MTPEELAEAFVALTPEQKGEFCGRIRTFDRANAGCAEEAAIRGSELPEWIVDQMLHAISLRRANEHDHHTGPDVTFRFYDDRENDERTVVAVFHFLSDETVVAMTSRGKSDQA
jgi:hypothetical protein